MIIKDQTILIFNYLIIYMKLYPIKHLKVIWFIIHLKLIDDNIMLNKVDEKFGYKQLIILINKYKIANILLIIKFNKIIYLIK